MFAEIFSQPKLNLIKTRFHCYRWGPALVLGETVTHSHIGTYFKPPPKAHTHTHTHTQIVS